MKNYEERGRELGYVAYMARVTLGQGPPSPEVIAVVRDVIAQLKEFAADPLNQGSVYAMAQAIGLENRLEEALR